MDVKEAIKLAKDYARELFEEEGMVNFGLEEVEYDVDRDAWNITVGFSRPWSSTKNALSAITGEPSLKRLYRVVHIDSMGNVISVKRRLIDESSINH
ncbi:hypothetical protein SAZ10_31970 [Mesorhizobium sp. BAC0120]|uniref:hypothetical protein n=1 Tax=Mesorhizobium sp. BAC0120 TaxID=3090670 RepID=UPI00298C08B6|nr:hypothetical protein [Mesorhizobium sp. BAC0120]MDW6026388.1 hypothetical protein [Mesorhizobium sp. BAC0120]